MKDVMTMVLFKYQSFLWGVLGGGIVCGSSWLTPFLLTGGLFAFLCLQEAIFGGPSEY